MTYLTVMTNSRATRVHLSSQSVFNMTESGRGNCNCNLVEVYEFHKNCCCCCCCCLFPFNCLCFFPLCTSQANIKCKSFQKALLASKQNPPLLLSQSSRRQVKLCWCSSVLLYQILVTFSQHNTRPATIHRCTGTSRYSRYEYRILNKVSWYLRYIYICINKHGNALSLIGAHPPSTYARRFSIQADEKNPCWAVFSIIFKMADTNVYVLPFSAVWAHEQDKKLLLLCNVSYRVSYHENCIRIRIVSWKIVWLQAYTTLTSWFRPCGSCYSQCKRSYSLGTG